MTDLLSYTGNTPIIKIAPHAIIRVDVPDDSSVIIESNIQRIVLRGK